MGPLYFTSDALFMDPGDRFRTLLILMPIYITVGYKCNFLGLTSIHCAFPFFVKLSPPVSWKFKEYVCGHVCLGQTLSFGWSSRRFAYPSRNTNRMLDIVNLLTHLVPWDQYNWSDIVPVTLCISTLSLEQVQPPDCCFTTTVQVSLEPWTQLSDHKASSMSTIFVMCSNQTTTQAPTSPLSTSVVNSSTEKAVQCAKIS